MKTIVCPACDGFGIISKCEIKDYGNGLGSGRVWSETCDRCHGTGNVKRPETNADRIRAMSDEELAWELMTWRIETEAKHHGVESTLPDTQKAILDWLQQPAEQT